jgi:hypothetical protein
MTIRKSIAAAALAALPLAVQAAPIVPTTNTAAGTIYNTAALTGFATFSANMVGSIVTVTFAGGGTSSANWTAAGASAAGWSLAVPGDTFSSNWTLANLGNNVITGMTFNGVPGNTVFDIVTDPTLSPGSARGGSIGSVDGPLGMTVDALYSNQLQVGGVFYGDLYTQLGLTFGGGGLGGGSSLTFVADTDNAEAARGGIVPGVPEPGTWAMMILGFGTIGFAMRRRRVNARVSFV